METEWIREAQIDPERAAIVRRGLGQAGVLVLCVGVGVAVGLEAFHRLYPEPGEPVPSWAHASDRKGFALLAWPLVFWTSLPVVPVGLWALPRVRPRRLLLPGLGSAVGIGLISGMAHLLGWPLSVLLSWVVMVLFARTLGEDPLRPAVPSTPEPDGPAAGR